MRRLEKKDSMNKRIDVVLRKFRSRMNSYPPGMCPLSLYRSLLQISINQSVREYNAVTDGEALKTGTQIKVVEVLSPDTVLVEPLESLII